MIDLFSCGIKAIIFDCDGTLVETLDAHYEAWDLIFKKNNVPLDLSYLEKYNSYPSWQIAEDLIKDGYLKGEPHQIAELKENLYLEKLVSAKPIERTIDYVKAYHKKLPLIVLSGGIRAGVLKSLELHNLVRYFDLIIGADDKYPPKTSPEVFRILAKELVLEPNQILIFEDGDMGIKNAKIAGIKVIDVRKEELEIV